MNTTELATVLDKHKKWLVSDPEGECADLSGADLSRANLSRANLFGADLSDADLSGAKLSYADLRDANLRGAKLNGANLNGANLKGADLKGANLSGATGLLNAIKWLASNFETTAEGYIAYKTFNSQYKAPGDWQIEPGAVITEVCHSDRTLDCACGINVATLKWVHENNGNNAPVWKVLIKWAWLIDAVVPYNTDGKWRTGRAQLIEIMEGQPGDNQ